MARMCHNCKLAQNIQNLPKNLQVSSYLSYVNIGENVEMCF